MKQILRTRRHGKTYDCIKLCIDNNATLIVPHFNEINMVKDMAFAEFRADINVICMMDYVSKRNASLYFDEKVVFDDLERCLLSIIPNRNELIGYSLNME